MKWRNVVAETFSDRVLDSISMNVTVAITRQRSWFNSTQSQLPFAPSFLLLNRPRRCVYAPSRVLFILVRGSLESLSSSTTSVRDSKAGSIRENFVIWPGYHDGGGGSKGKGICASIPAECYQDTQFEYEQVVILELILKFSDSESVCTCCFLKRPRRFRTTILMYCFRLLDR